MTFRNVLPHEAEILTTLTFASKQHWGYPQKWMQIWADELTISPKYIQHNYVVAAEIDAQIAGYISVSQDEDGSSLDNLFIHPNHIRKGIGEKLVKIALNWCKDRQIKELFVYSDPFSRGFYEKTGAEYVREIESQKIPGRFLPLLVYKL